MNSCEFQLFSVSNSCKDEFWMLDIHLSLQSSVLQLFGKKTLKGKLHMRKVGTQGLTIQHLKMQAFEKKSERNMGWRCRAHTKYILNSEHPFEIQSFMFLADILSIVLRSCPGTTGVKMNFEKKRKPRSYHPKFTMAGDQKENYERKRGRNPRSTIQSSFSLVLCHDTAQNYR